MIVKSSGSSGGYTVVSKEGKNLSRPGLSKKAAAKRLGQIEWFKHHGSK